MDPTRHENLRSGFSAKQGSDFTTEEKRVREALCRGPQFPHPQLSVKSSCPSMWAHRRNTGHAPWGKQQKAVCLTNGAVGTHPVGIAAAEASVGEVSAVPTALVWALDPRQLTVQTTPARAAKAFSIDTDPMAGARWIQTIN